MDSNEDVSENTKDHSCIAADTTQDEPAMQGAKDSASFSSPRELPGPVSEPQPKSPELIKDELGDSDGPKEDKPASPHISSECEAPSGASSPTTNTTTCNKTGSGNNIENGSGRGAPKRRAKLEAVTKMTSKNTATPISPDTPKPKRRKSASKRVRKPLVASKKTKCPTFTAYQSKVMGHQQNYLVPGVKLRLNEQDVTPLASPVRDGFDDITIVHSFPTQHPLSDEVARPFEQNLPFKTVQHTNLIQMINTDKKLSIFTGIPSFQVLDSLSDATLKMVLRSQQLINDIEPILRTWIIITCSKLMLNVSFEVTSVMFDLDLEECTRIFKRTCLFLRKALVLPECQVYIPVIPLTVLNGIADCTDALHDEGH